MLCIFDIDGTTCDSRSAEGEAFAQAIFEVTGYSLASLDWSTYKEPTSASIVRGILKELNMDEDEEIRIKKRFMDLLLKYREKSPEEFYPLRGALEFIEQLSASMRFKVSFATGCYDFEAKYKLQCCGLNIEDFPHATSSDTPKRTEVIKLSISRAGFSSDSVIYFGDGVWDVKASDSLSIPMIGIGRKIADLSKLGIRNVFRDFRDKESILEILENYRKNSQPVGGADSTR